MISCKCISKAFPGQSVIDGLSYDFADTGFYLLYGESGSGKTTFLNVLAGFLPFDGGSIDWNGYVFSGQVENDIIKRDFDYITQDPFFVDFLTVADNLRLITEDDAAIMSALSRVGLGDMSERYPLTLSGGEKQRFALARALLGGKRVLLLDEPTASLDEENKRLVLSLLADLAGELLIICSTHDGKAREYSDKVIVFSKSKKSPPPAVNTPVKRKKHKNAAPKDKKRIPYLEKYFSYKSRNRIAAVLFGVFLVMSICLCFLADTPQNKTESTIENLYKVNSFQIWTNNRTKWSDICPEDFDGYAVMSYMLSTPTVPGGGSEPAALPFDMLEIIPFDGAYFRVSDRIKYGSYFTSERQVILSSAMAKKMEPKDPASLIGKTISRNIYLLGETDFEIVGIFEDFDDIEKEYLRSVGFSFDNYEDLCFFNSELMKVYEDDESCYRGSNEQRGYRLYFKSYAEAKRHHARMCSLEDGDPDLMVGEMYFNFDVKRLFDIMFSVCMPIAIAMAVFSAMFYIELKKTEFMHNSGFISVYEYSGYSKERVLNKFIWLNILKFIKTYAVSAAVAFVLTLGINGLNEHFIFVSFRIFSYDLWIDLAFLTFIILLFLCFTNAFFRRTKIRSWYENLISDRDLI